MQLCCANPPPSLECRVRFF
uniref:Uncharacterized protein n=1 Tax=Anguilla anguilla TaxID=7936 RepID=A0A0E9TRP0_ANGAN